MYMEGSLNHMDWVTNEPTLEGLDALLSILFQESQMFTSDFPSLSLHNSNERQGQMDWESDYPMPQMHLISN